MGLRKIEIKKIEDPSKLQVTFSKRHAGLFKKTAELCRLCDVEATVITHTPVKKTPYVFGYPDPDTVINRFLNENNSNNNNNHVSDCVVKEEAEGIHEEEEREKFWWEQPIDDLDVEGLMKFKAALTELRNNVLTRADEMMMQDISAGADSAGSAVQEPVVGGERGNYGGGFNHCSAAVMDGDGIGGSERGCYTELRNNVLTRADEMMMQDISAGADSAGSAVQEPVVGGERGNYGGGFNHCSAAVMDGDGIGGSERGCYTDGGNVPQGFGIDGRIAMREYMGESSTTGTVRGPVDGGDERECHGDCGYVPPGFGFHDFIARISK